MVLGDVASWRRLYLVAKRSHVGVNVDRLAYHLHRLMTCDRQMRGEGCLLVVALSHRYCGRWRLSRGCEAPEFDILWSVERLATRVTESYIE
jgi:hypothetical protein